MRYIGSKANLLEEIDGLLTPHLTGKEYSFYDVFGGSNVVGKYFKSRFKIVSNDLMYFSHVIGQASIELNQAPTFTKLYDMGIEDPFKYLQAQKLDNYVGGYVTESYSPQGKAGRMYFTVDNAKRIDYIRETIDSWEKQRFIDQSEKYYLLDALIQAIPYVSNTTGTYGAYLKHWDKRANKSLELVPSEVIDNKHNNRALNEDAVELVHNVSGDILYIDTPYNNRQYAPNYHVLETIAKNDKPELHGITGQRDNTSSKSKFAMKTQAKDAMIELVKDLDFSHVVLSYSTDGIITEVDLLNILKSVALNNEVEVKRIPYRKYKSKIFNPETDVYELLFYFQPKKAKYIQKLSHNNSDKSNHKRTVTRGAGFIKSPLNYIGGKYKLLPQIMPFFPKKIDIFVDLFSGGGNVGINVNANKVYFNDFNTKINDLFRYFQGKNPEQLVEHIKERISTYDLSKTNEEAFKKFRQKYNENPTPLDLYTLVAFSFNYQFRFNNNLEYNNPFGRNRSHFSQTMEQNLLRFVHHLNEIDAEFTDSYFNQFDQSILTQDSFVYADPPYLITTGSYNDGNRGFVNWTEQQEVELYTYLDELHAKGIKFALSNVLEHKGHSNELLKAWSKKYKVHVLNYDYKNASHNTVALDSIEVLITNY